MQKRITTILVFAAVLLTAYMYSGKTDCVFWLGSRVYSFLQQSPPAFTTLAGRIPTLARGIPTLAGGSYLGRGYPTWPEGYLPWPGGTYLGRGGTHPVDRQTDTCEKITFPSYYIHGQ